MFKLSLPRVKGAQIHLNSAGPAAMPVLVFLPIGPIPAPPKRTLQNKRNRSIRKKKRKKKKRTNQKKENITKRKKRREKRKNVLLLTVLNSPKSN